MIINIIYLLFALYIIFNILYFFEKKSNEFTMYFGVPGSGKTTMGAYIYKRLIKRNKKLLKHNKPTRRIFSNFSLKDAYQLEKQDIGLYDISNSLLLYDEISFDFNNRDFKSNFSKEQLKFFKLHRHYNVDIVMFSQGWDDADKKLRDLTTKMFIVKKSFFPFCISKRAIRKKISIHEMEKTIIDEYYFVPFSRRIIFSPPLWKLFNSYDAPVLPKKEFKKW